MNRTVIIMLCCAVFFTRCSLRIAGVETTNGKIAIVRMADGSRASGAKVTIVACNDWYAKRSANATVVVDTAIADHNGAIVFKRSWPNLIAFQIATDSQGLWMPVVSTVPGSRVDTFDLRGLGTISGQVASNSAGAVYLAGTSFESTVIVASGSFAFSKVPSGNYAVLIPATDSTGTSHLAFCSNAGVVPNANVPLGAISPTDTFVLSEFDASSFTCGLEPITGGGHWYYFDDAATGGTSSANMVFDSGFTGLGVRLDAILRKSTPITTYSGIGLFLGINSDSTLQYCNLSHLKAFSFMAKGKGRLGADFLTKLTPGSQRFSTTVQLGPSWQKFVVPVDSLALPNSPYTWTQVSDRVKIMNFVILAPADSLLPDTVSVWLDDVRLIGMTADELMSH